MVYAVIVEENPLNVGLHEAQPHGHEPLKAVIGDFMGIARAEPSYSIITSANTIVEIINAGNNTVNNNMIIDIR